MLAVTVVTPTYRHLEKEAVKRFRKNSGLPVKVIRCKDDEGFMTKLELDRLCGKKRIVFFDVDYWLLRPVDFSQWHPNNWYAVHDSAVFNHYAFPHTDCEKFTMDKMLYFNSGFFSCNLALEEHRAVFKRARKIAALVRRGNLEKPTDVTDQFYLNAACQKLVYPSFLPLKFNYYHRAAQWGQIPYIPRDVIGLHAAGEPLESKLQALQVQSQVFGADLLRVCAEAYQYETSRIFDMR